MFALPISKPRFKSVNFYQNIPKIKLFLQKNAIFFVWWGLRPQNPVPSEAGALPLDSQPPAAGGFAPRPPKHPLISNFWLRPGGYIAVMLFCVN